jgi:hypothetical protein
MSIKEIPFGIAVVAMLMILFGLAEVVTGFTHDFFGISTSQAATFIEQRRLICCGSFTRAVNARLLSMM